MSFKVTCIKRIFRSRSTAILRTFHIFNHFALIFGILFGAWWMWLASLVWWNVIASFGISIGYHRLLSHKSFRVPLAFEKFCVAIGCLAMGGAPLSWVGAHRMHHCFPDKEGDPHSAKLIGVVRTYFHIWPYFQIPRRLVRDLLRKPYIIWWQRHYFKVLIGWMVLWYTIDPLFGVFICSVPGVIAVHAFGMVNTLCHWVGYTNYDTGDSSKNNWWVNLWTCGEGWHNNHHKYPSRYRFGDKPWEFDLSAWLIEKFNFTQKKT